MKKRWKRILSIVVCITMVLSCNAQVFALTSDFSNDLANDITQNEQGEDDSYSSDAIQADGTSAKAEAADEHSVQIADSVETHEAVNDNNADTSQLTVTDSGTIGNVKWAVYTNGLLEISGEGAVPSYKNGTAPWNNYLNLITSIFVGNTITAIGESAFAGCNEVSEITLPFVGKSRSATGYESNFGYIFDFKATGYGGSKTG